MRGSGRSVTHEFPGLEPSEVLAFQTIDGRGFSDAFAIASVSDPRGIQHSHDGAGAQVEAPQQGDVPPLAPGAGESNHVHGRQRAAAGESRK